MNLTLTLTILGFATFFGGIFLINYITKKYNRTIPEVLGGILMFGWGVLIMGSTITIFNQYEESILQLDERHEYWIQSLGNDKYMEGDIGLFSGTINETDYYFFYVSYQKGMAREKLNISDCFIVEGDYEKPEVKATYRTYNDDDKFWKIWNDFEPDYYTIYVPKGTIIREFKVR